MKNPLGGRGFGIHRLWFCCRLSSPLREADTKRGEMHFPVQNGRPRWSSSTGAVVVFGKKTRKPNSVYAVIPLGAALPRTLISDLPGGSGDCSSRLAASGRCAAGAWLLAPASLPIWSCSVWGLPCRRHYCRRGALLPHLFTLTTAWGRLLEGR